MSSFKAKVVRKIFSAADSGFGVFKVHPLGARESTVITGNLFDVKEGDFLLIEGEETEHPRFGRQIKVLSFTPILPQDTEGIAKYLASGRIRGIGSKTAEKIVEHFGAMTFHVLENNPERLSEIPGIRKAIIDETRRSFKDNKILRDLSARLLPFAVGGDTIFKIFQEFGEQSFSILEQNPYILVERVRGIGFKTADAIGRAFRIEAGHPSRIRAGVQFTLAQYVVQNGHMCISEEELRRRSATLLGLDDADVQVELENMVVSGQLQREPGPEAVLVSGFDHLVEATIAKRLHHLSRSLFAGHEIPVDFAFIFQQLAVSLTEEQKQAVSAAMGNRITIITGGPGTGKTTIIRAIVEACRAEKRHVLLAAPTGRAAKRIEESTLYKASTIHRLLKVNPETGRFVHNEANPLRADVIIIDEFSMVDAYLLYSLLNAVAPDTRLVIIGDKDQLPSVGPGNVLRDLIVSDYFPVTYLNRNFRQSQNSLIVENAYRIQSGDDLLFPAYSDELDFVLLRVAGERQAAQKIEGIVRYYYEEFRRPEPVFQILAPMYRGEAGIDRLNQMIQERFNPEPFLVKKEKTAFKRLDKVMQLRNDYEKEVFNGDQGIVQDYDRDENTLIVNFDGLMVEYSGEELDDLTLSYTISIHKSQGSEYDIIVLVLLPGHAVMLNRELLYTAVTRARKRLLLLSDEATVRRACANSMPLQRKTLLPKRLKEMFEPGSVRAGQF